MCFILSLSGMQTSSGMQSSLIKAQLKTRIIITLKKKRKDNLTERFKILLLFSSMVVKSQLSDNSFIGR